MIVLSGADLILPDRILLSGTLVIDGGRIADIREGARPGGAVDLSGHYIAPGFIDVHVHGVEGIDTLDGGPAIASIAGRLPRFGVTAFCPTTVACAPDALRQVLDSVRRARETPAAGARVLPAHLESNFINAEYKGAQPAACLRSPVAALRGRSPAEPGGHAANSSAEPDFDGADILREIERASAQIGIVTIAPELDGGLDLVAWLASRGHRVSLGHSGANYELAFEAIAAGARHATHLFNRMPPLGHRSPGLAGAVLQSHDVAAELICDCFHVHPAMIARAIAAKGPSRIFAITDGTSAAGLPVGARASLGGQAITVGSEAAHLDDGTLAGSVLTMDRAFHNLVERVGLSLVDAVQVCSTTPARELGLRGRGVLASDADADVVVLDRQMRVARTYVAGQLVYSKEPPSA